MFNNFLSISAISTEIVDAAYRLSSTIGLPVLVGLNKTYGVTSINTALFDFQYPDNQISIYRQKCGPLHNTKEDLKETFKTIETDLRAGLDIIHLDFSKFQVTRVEYNQKLLDAVRYCLKIKPDAKIILGSEDVNDYNRIVNDLNNILPHCNPYAFVVDTGSEVREDFQFGVFNTDRVRQLRMLLSESNTLLFEYNSDYLTTGQLELRKDLVDSLNLSTQLGITQTDTILNLADQYGVSTEAWIEVCYKSKLWKPMLYTLRPEDDYACATLVGHYNYNCKEYENLLNKLNNCTNVSKEIKEALDQILEPYVSSFLKGSFV